MTFWAYYKGVFARAWRDWVAFLKTQILVSLAVAVLTAMVTGPVSADVGERFNVQVALYAALLAALVVAVCGLAGTLVLTPWRLHDELAARLGAYEERPDVGRLIDLRERGVHLLNRPISENEEQLADWVSTLRSWEDETAAELEKCATKIDASEFRVLGTLVPRVFVGVITVHQGEMTMLAERLERLAATIRRIEGDAGL